MSDGKSTPVAFDSVCVYSPSDTIVYHHKVTFQDFKILTEQYGWFEKLLGNEFKIPIKSSSLPCYIEVYPSGRREEDKGFVTIYLYTKPSDSMDYMMSVEYSIIDSTGKSKGCPKKNVPFF